MNDRMGHINTIHFIGIGGVGMAGIAEVLLGLGYRVQGSDLKASKATARLARLGASRILAAAGGRPPPGETLENLLEDQRACWLARSEPGGLEDSLARIRPA